MTEAQQKQIEEMKSEAELQHNNLLESRVTMTTQESQAVQRLLDTFVGLSTQPLPTATTARKKTFIVIWASGRLSV